MEMEDDITDGTSPPPPERPTTPSMKISISDKMKKSDDNDDGNCFVRYVFSLSPSILLSCVVIIIYYL